MNEANNIFTNFNFGSSNASYTKDDIKNIETALHQVKVEIHKSLAILIERFNIFNMENEWNNILPLYTAINDVVDRDTINQQIEQTKNALFEIVKRKYMIGKCLWFLYQGVVCLIMTSLLVNI
jgi:hypothetical protein